MPSKRDVAASFRFEGFDSPNTTPVPDVLFDLLAPNLTEAELRVLLYIIRRTYGFKKNSDDISLKQMVEGITKKDGTVQDLGAGIAKSAASRAVKGLIEKGIITAQRNRSDEKGDEPTTYHLRFKQQGLIPSVSNGQDEDPVFSKSTRGGPPREQDRVLQRNPQETVIQETDVSLSNFERSHDAHFSDASDWRQPARGAPEGPEMASDASEPRQRPNMPPAVVSRATGPGNAENEPLSERSVSQEFIVARDAIRSTLATRMRMDGEERRRSRRTDSSSSLAQPQPGPRAISAASVVSQIPSRPGRPVGTSDERDLVYAYLDDFNRELLHDDAPIASLVTQTINIFCGAHIPRERWPEYLYQARTAVKEHAGSITKASRTNDERKNRGPYYFAVLRDLVNSEPAANTNRRDRRRNEEG